MRLLLHRLSALAQIRGVKSSLISAERIRNVGVVAHIDAGKTTLTERLLYLSGELKRMGDVDSGTTLTDFLEVERERGITVQSALVSLPWNDHCLNLIDTPGHVDFGVEVQRCVRVLDGLLVVIDSSAGVQAQTLTVWKQAASFALPAVFMLNKMDKPQADFAASLSSIEHKLHVKALPVVVPWTGNKGLEGFIDVVNGRRLDLERPVWEAIEGGTREWDKLQREKETLSLAIADCDGQFEESFLAHGDVARIQSVELIEGLRRASLSRVGAAVVAGSALRCAESARPCLDLIAQLLPSPEESSRSLNSALGEQFSGVLFKIVHDKRKGLLAYIRIYSGNIKNGAYLWNHSRQKKEGPIELYTVQGDAFEKVDSAGPGNILVVTGLSHSRSGDALITTELAENAIEMENLPECASLFHGTECSEPVTYCSVEAPSGKGRGAFERALAELVLEDPSLRTRIHPHTQERMLETCGQLHLEIVKHRLKKDYGLDVFMGPIQVAFREMPVGPVEHTVDAEDTVDGKMYNVSLTILLEPAPGVGEWKKLKVDLPDGSRKPTTVWLQAIQDGISSSLRHGPLLCFPVYDVAVTLLEFSASGGRVGSNLVCAATQKCVQGALSKCGTSLLEPMMQVEVTLPSDCSTAPVLQELNQRRATILDHTNLKTGENSIRADLPMSTFTDLSNSVRTLSRGLAHLSVRPGGYQMVDGGQQAKMLHGRRPF